MRDDNSSAPYGFDGPITSDHRTRQHGLTRTLYHQQRAADKLEKAGDTPGSTG